MRAREATGSGVVRPGPGSNPGAASRPSVPRLAALVPPSRQIWRRKSTVLVLPLVPVTATTTAGWRPASRAARLRQAPARLVVLDQGGAAARLAARRCRSGASTARAPRSTASAMKCVPSVRLPGRAANRKPGRTSPAVGGDAGHQNRRAAVSACQDGTRLSSRSGGTSAPSAQRAATGDGTRRRGARRAHRRCSPRGRLMAESRGRAGSG